MIETIGLIIAGSGVLASAIPTWWRWLRPEEPDDETTSVPQLIIRPEEVRAAWREHLDECERASDAYERAIRNVQSRGYRTTSDFMLARSQGCAPNMAYVAARLIDEQSSRQLFLARCLVAVRRVAPALIVVGGVIALLGRQRR